MLKQLIYCWLNWNCRLPLLAEEKTIWLLPKLFGLRGKKTICVFVLLEREKRERDSEGHWCEGKKSFGKWSGSTRLNFWHELPAGVKVNIRILFHMRREKKCEPYFKLSFRHHLIPRTLFLLQQEFNGIKMDHHHSKTRPENFDRFPGSGSAQCAYKDGYNWGFKYTYNHPIIREASIPPASQPDRRTLLYVY